MTYNLINHDQHSDLCVFGAFHVAIDCQSETVGVDAGQWVIALTFPCTGRLGAKEEDVCSSPLCHVVHMIHDNRLETFSSEVHDLMTVDVDSGTFLRVSISRRKLAVQ